MEVTVFQITGVALILFFGPGAYSGYIAWVIEAGPSVGCRNRFNIDPTSDKYMYQKESRIEGRWVRPICIVDTIVGIGLLFVPGDMVVFTI